MGKNMQKLVCFAHGKESGPWGTKITYLADIARDAGWDVISPDYSHTHDPGLRVKQLLELNPQAEHLVLAGSSMGAYVTAIACKELQPSACFLMAPALYFEGWNEEPDGCPQNTVVVHGWKDEVVPVDVAIRFSRPRHATLHILDSGHDLNDQLPILGRVFGDMLTQVLSGRTL